MIKKTWIYIEVVLYTTVDTRVGGPDLICETISFPYIRWKENDTRIDNNSEIVKHLNHFTQKFLVPYFIPSLKT